MDDKKLKKMERLLENISKKLDKQEQRIAELEQDTGKPFYEEKPEVIKPPKKEPEKPKKKVAARRKKEYEYKPIDWKKIELTIGKYFLQVVGAAIFVLGMVFFFKYAIDQGWINPAMRVVAGFVVAATFVVIGEFVNKKGWALGCVAGGISLFYISCYAAYNLYGIFNNFQAILVVSGVTALTFIFSLRHDSRLIAFFGLVGGFLSPVFLEKMALFAPAPKSSLFTIYYVFVVAAVFVLLALVKRWKQIAVVTFISSFIHMYFFLLFYPADIDLKLVGVQSLVFFGIFTFTSYLFGLFSRKKAETFEATLATFGCLASFVFLFFEIIIVRGRKLVRVAEGLIYPADTFKGALTPTKWLLGMNNFDIFKYLCLGAGVVYLLKSIVLLLVNKKQKYLLAAIGTMAIASFGGVIMFHWKGNTLASVLQLYAFVVILLSFFLKSRFLRIVSIPFWSSAAWIYLSRVPTQTFVSPVWNELNYATLALVAVFGASAFVVHRFKKQLSKEEEFLPALFESGIFITLIAWFNTTLWQYPYKTIGLAAFSCFVFFIGSFFSRKHIRFCAYGSLALSLFFFVRKYGIMVFKYEQNHALIFGAVALSFALLAFIAHQFKKQFKEEERFAPQIFETGLLVTAVAWFNTAFWEFPYYILNHVIYVPIVLFIGAFFSRKHARVCSYGTTVLGLFLLWTKFRTMFVNKDLYNLNLLLGAFVVSFFAASFILKFFKKKVEPNERTLIKPIAEVLATLTIILIGYVNILLRVESTQVQSSSLAVFFGASSLILVFVGLFLRKTHIRYLGLGTAGTTLWMLWYVIMGLRDTGSRVIAFIAIGLLFILVSFVYQRLSKRLF